MLTADRSAEFSRYVPMGSDVARAANRNCRPAPGVPDKSRVTVRGSVRGCPPYQRNNANPPREQSELRRSASNIAPSLVGRGTHMGLFDGVLGGVVGASMVSVVNGILEKHGGVQGIVNEFEKNGLGPTVKSWVGTGPNDPVSPTDVHRVLGPDLLQQLSARSGLSVQELSEKLAQVLPQAVDRMTPDGTIPKA